MQKIDRRTFTATAAASAVLGLSATAAARIRGANDRIRIGLIGVGKRGSQLSGLFQRQPDAEIVAAADVYQPYLARAREQIGNSLETYGDCRRVIDRSDLDAVVIATPDHWHAI